MTARFEELNRLLPVPKAVSLGDARAAAWSKLLGWGATPTKPNWRGFFSYLREGVQEAMRWPEDRRTAVTRDWHDWLESWRLCHTLLPNIAKGDSRLYPRRQAESRRRVGEWVVLSSLLHATKRTLDRPEWYSSIGDVEDSVFSPTIQVDAAEKSRQRVIGRLLLADSMKCHAVRVPVALLRQEEGGHRKRGFLGLLECTVIKEGTGTVYRHPIDDLVAQQMGAAAVDVAFGSAMQGALDAARMEVSDRELCDGVWSLSSLAPSSGGAGPSGLHPAELIPSPEGASAGGAAFRAYWHAIQRLTPDEEVVVVAELARDVECGFVLRGVVEGEKGGWIREKVAAVVEEGAGRFDTLVVVEDQRQNEGHAREALRSAKSKITLHVLMPDA